MMGRVKFTPPSYVGMSLNWNELVQRPFNEGYVVESFANADALIDDQIESLLRHVYSDNQSQDLINEIHLLRTNSGLDGLGILQILESKTIVNKDFVEAVRRFKKARNLVVHSTEGEYALVIGNHDTPYKSQEELDARVVQESQKWLREALDIFCRLTEKFSSIDPKYYFSNEFYRANPRGKQAQKNYPKMSK